LDQIKGDRVRMSVTLKDLADYVGKSVTTVSRALADYDDVSPATREQVRQAAQELGYEPNIIARQLQKKRTDTIALILPPVYPRISDPFFSELLSGLVEQFTRHGLDLLVSVTSSSDNQTDTYLKFMRSRRADGFIIVRTQRQDPRIDLLRQHNYPFVAFGRIEGDNDFPLIDDDDELGVQLVVDHLVELGHTRLAFIAEPLEFTKPYHRAQGFMKSLKSHGLPVDSALILEGGYRQHFGQAAAHRLLEKSNPPTAIVACNDLLCLGAVKAAQERGLIVGRDVSITGFDDISFAEYATSPLTTVHQPAYRIGKMLCRMLVKIINQEQLTEKQIILQPKLVVRQSSGPVSK